MRWLGRPAVIGACVIAGASVVLAAQSAIGTDNPAEIAEGRVLYAVHCAACHGADLEGQPDWRTSQPDGTLRAPPHDDSGHTWHHPDRLLIDYVTLGGAETLRRLTVTGIRSGMPAFGELLSEDEIEAVLDYIASHWSERARAYQAEVTRQAEGN